MRGRARTIVLLLTLVACGARERGGPAVPPLARDPTVLRVGTSGDYPPFSNRSPDGDLAGFDVEVARAYARARGLRVVFVPFRWPELPARLAAGDFDVAMSGVTVRGDRLLIGTMTPEVARAESVLVVRREPPSSGAGPRAPGFDRPEVRIAVNRGGHLERVLRAKLPHATIVPVDDNRALADLLSTAAVDAVVSDTLELTTFAAPFQVAARLSHDRKAYWVRPGDEALGDDLNHWILARERDGTLPTLRARYLGAAVSSPLPPDVTYVVDLVARRLMLMPLVAAAKRAHGLAIDDPGREAEVERSAAERAAANGLEPGPYLDFVRAERALAKEIQRVTPPNDDPAPPLAELRATIDRLDTAIGQALKRAAPVRVQAAQLREALRADADLPAADDRMLDAIAASLQRLLR